MKFRKKYIFSIAVAIVIAGLDVYFFYGSRWFVPGIVLAVTIGWAQFWIDYFIENKRQKEYEGRFLDFVRDLVGAIKSGMPVSRAIIHVGRLTDFGSLDRHIKQLANQVEWAIPVHRALINFANRTRNDVIRRAISTVIEAEQAGGNIDEVLESITVSLLEIKRIKEERRASIHSQVIQSYIIFFVFLGVMIVIQNLLIPYMGQMGGNIEGTEITLSASEEIAGLTTDVKISFDSLQDFALTVKSWLMSMKGVFLMLSLIQGFFAGIIIGKLSEGDLSSGLKHSLILMTIAFFLISLAFG